MNVVVVDTFIDAGTEETARFGSAERDTGDTQETLVM